MEKTSSDKSLLNRRYGARCAGLIQERLDQFGKAKNLAGLRSVPKGRCHELKGKRKGTLAVDLEHPFRLIFEPANNPIPKKPDGGLDWEEVTAIRILSVEDYHD